MSTKFIIVFCAQVLFMQSALSQCTSRVAIASAPGIATSAMAAPCGIGAPYGLSAAYGINAPCGRAAPYGIDAIAIEIAPTSGGLLPVSSASAFAPVGLSVASKNVYEGALAVIGELPFIGTVGLEGVLPTAGAGAVNHACGNGRSAMISEGAAYAPGYAGAAAIAPFGAIAPGIAAPALGYRGDLAGRGCGCAF